MSARIKLSPDNAFEMKKQLDELLQVIIRDQRNVGLCLWVEKTPMKWSIEAEFYPLNEEEGDAETAEEETAEEEPVADWGNGTDDGPADTDADD